MQSSLAIKIGCEKYFKMFFFFLLFWIFFIMKTKRNKIKRMRKRRLAGRQAGRQMKNFAINMKKDMF